MTLSSPGRGSATLPAPGRSLVWLLRPALIASAVPLALVVEASWVWAAALVAFGMPHGAYDLAAIHRETRRNARRTAGVFALYTAVMLACAAAFVVAPAAALVAFLVLTAHHFGVSDSVATRGGRRAGAFAHAAAFARGAVVIGAPFAFQPEPAWAPFAAMTGLVGPVQALDAEAIRLAGAWATAAGLVLVSAHALRLASRSASDRSGLSGAAEELIVPVVVALAAMVAPPLLVVGVYFVAVHASGHCFRAVSPSHGPAAASVRRGWRTHRASAPLLVPSLAIVAGMALLFGGLTMETLAYGFILFCVFATLPHHLLWMLGVPGGRRAGAEGPVPMTAR